MGQKVHPTGIRLGINRDYLSTWFHNKKYAKYVYNDFQLRNAVKVLVARAGVSKVIIKRRSEQIEILIYAARPGIIIGKGGSEIDKIKMQLQKIAQHRIQLNIHEEKNIDQSAAILGDGIARQLEKRIAFRRAMKQTIARAQKSGAKGIKIQCSGRLGGVEIARREWYREGRVPLQTFRANIDYSFTEANTVYGKIGVKVWVYLGDLVSLKREDEIVEGS